jgi:hypothetical protein
MLEFVNTLGTGDTPSFRFHVYPVAVVERPTRSLLCLGLKNPIRRASIAIVEWKSVLQAHFCFLPQFIRIFVNFKNL